MKPQLPDEWKKLRAALDLYGRIIREHTERVESFSV
jgi:hypothetical protein